MKTIRAAHGIENRTASVLGAIRRERTTSRIIVAERRLIRTYDRQREVRFRGSTYDDVGGDRRLAQSHRTARLRRRTAVNSVRAADRVCNGTAAGRSVRRQAARRRIWANVSVGAMYDARRKRRQKQRKRNGGILLFDTVIRRTATL